MKAEDIYTMNPNLRNLGQSKGAVHNGSPGRLLLPGLVLPEGLQRPLLGHWTLYQPCRGTI